MNKNTFGRIVVFALALLLCVASVASANVSKGDKGSEVSSIQQRLVDLGYLTGKVDGQFGGKTEQAVKDFQRAMGLIETGVVDDTTWSVLFDPNVHASYFAKMQRIGALNLSTFTAGINDKGYSVEYCIMFEIPVDSWMTEMPTIQLDWSNDPIDASNDAYIDPAWNNAKRGITSYSITKGWYADDSEYIGINVFLPDDPNLNGRHWIEMNGMGDKIIAYFTLKYIGDYLNGSGWKLTDYSVEMLPSENVKLNYDDKVEYTVKKDNAFKALEYELDPYFVTGDDEKDNPEYNIGRNNKGNLINSYLYIWIDNPTSEMSLETISWNNDYIDRDYLSSTELWDSMKRGKTAVSTNYYTETGSDGNNYGISSIEIYLPDNPAIEGEQWISVICDNQRATIRLNLKYLGSYQTGRGWDVSFIGTTVSQIVG